LFFGLVSLCFNLLDCSLHLVFGCRSLRLVLLVLCMGFLLSMRDRLRDWGRDRLTTGWGRDRLRDWGRDRLGDWGRLRDWGCDLLRDWGRKRCLR